MQAFQASWEWKEKERIVNGTAHSLPSLSILSLCTTDGLLSTYCGVEVNRKEESTVHNRVKVLVGE